MSHTRRAANEVEHDAADEGPRDTKEALLDAAEELFEAQGASATSLRAITERASANIAAVNYHFGSKDALVLAVLERRIRPLNEERLEWLDRLEAEGEDDLESVLEALMAPALQYAEGCEGFVRLLGRLHFEADVRVRGLLLENFAEVARRFVAAIHRRASHLTATDVLWRLHFAIGAMAMTATNREDLALFSRGGCAAGDAREATARLVEFLAAGFRAPRAGQHAASATVLGSLSPGPSGEEDESS